MFYYNKSYNLAIAQIPKVGSQSFKEWLKFKVVSNDVARQADTRVAFIRHPLERLKSAYSMMHYTGDRGSTWVGFVDKVLDDWKDEHVRAQILHIGDVPNIYHKFENLLEHWEKYKKGVLPHLNRCSRVGDINNYREEELLEMYKEDLKLWEFADGS